MSTNRALATVGLVTTVICVAGMMVLAADSPGKSGLAGEWQGAVKSGAIQLRLLYKFQKSADGELSGVMVGVDQGNVELPFDVVTCSRPAQPSRQSSMARSKRPFPRPFST